MKVKELIMLLSEKPKDAGVFVMNEDGSISPVCDLIDNDITETDYMESVILI